MTAAPFPARADTRVLFAHAAYQMGARLSARHTGLAFDEVRTLDDLKARSANADVIVVSGLWRNELLDSPRLRFVQSISAGTDQYDKDAFRARGVRLASATGVNERAVAEHAIALVLAFARRLHLLRDAQAQRHWRPMLSDLVAREDELGGRTLLVVGLGRIGTRIARLGKALEMRVIATKRDPSKGGDAVDALYPDSRLQEALAEADYVVLSCPLTPQTERLIGAAALAAMKPSAVLVNVARGKVVDEPALVAALQAGRIAGAAVDVTVEEPLPAASPLWAMPNVIVTPHAAGETKLYEDNVLDILMENLDRLWRGETALRNQIV
jgi:phosphoglycerate dehydrogenase-like enzyme